MSDDTLFPLSGHYFCSNFVICQLFSPLPLFANSFPLFTKFPLYFKYAELIPSLHLTPFRSLGHANWIVWVYVAKTTRV